MASGSFEDRLADRESVEAFAAAQDRGGLLMTRI
jgi:hypothetical protein